MEKTGERLENDWWSHGHRMENAYGHLTDIMDLTWKSHGQSIGKAWVEIGERMVGEWSGTAQ